MGVKWQMLSTSALPLSRTSPPLLQRCLAFLLLHHLVPETLLLTMDLPPQMHHSFPLMFCSFMASEAEKGRGIEHRPSVSWFSKCTPAAPVAGAPAKSLAWGQQTRGISRQASEGSRHQCPGGFPGLPAGSRALQCGVFLIPNGIPQWP